MKMAELIPLKVYPFSLMRFDVILFFVYAKIFFLLCFILSCFHMRLDSNTGICFCYVLYYFVSMTGWIKTHVFFYNVLCYYRLSCEAYLTPYPVGIGCQNDVVLTSMRRNHIASTSVRRHFYVMCPLGKNLNSKTSKL